MIPELTHAHLLDVLDYNPETGRFTWKNSGRPGHNGKVAGKIGAGSYNYAVIGIQFNGKSRNYGISRLAWFYVHGVWPKGQLRFVNGDASDARITNLMERPPATRNHRSGKPCDPSLPLYRPKYNPNSQRRGDLKSRFGITAEQYVEMLTAQHGVCAICAMPETIIERGVVRQLAVDHDHLTGKVRGLLCGRCNMGIGRFGDDPNLLARAITYLHRHTSDGSNNVMPLRLVVSGDES